MNERYSFDKAAEEATCMTAKIEAGQAKDYSEAEKQVESEKGEIVPVLVSVEELIPNIKPKGSTGLAGEESRDLGHDWDDAYAGNLPMEVMQAFSEVSMYRVNRALGDKFKNQVVVDLGAGNFYGYEAAVIGEAKGYVAVDKYNDLSRMYADPKEVKDRMDDNDSFAKGRDIIPAAVELDDMLSFLRRLPDNSVSIISSGQIDVIDNQKYREEVRKEVARVLSDEGFLIVNSGIGADLDLEEEIYNEGFFRVFLKKDSERYRKMAGEWEIITQQVNAESDPQKLWEMYKKAEDEEKDEKFLAIISRRMKKVQSEE